MRIIKGVAHRKIDGRVYVVDSKNSSLHSLNETGSYIWERLAAGSDEKKIAASIASRYDIPEADAVKDVSDFIKKLKAKNLVEP